MSALFKGGCYPSQRPASCPDRVDPLSGEGACSSSVADDQDLRDSSHGVSDRLNPSESTIYFDGSCPLCRAEIGYYRDKDRAGALCFTDVSKPGTVTPEGINRQLAMERFHVRASDGRLLSGAAAFVEVWARLPNWRWAARAASLPGALTFLELGYRMFLPVRPFVSRLVGGVMQPRRVKRTEAAENQAVRLSLEPCVTVPAVTEACRRQPSALISPGLGR